jgi:hypothetical protein
VKFIGLKIQNGPTGLVQGCNPNITYGNHMLVLKLLTSTETHYRCKLRNNKKYDSAALQSVSAAYKYDELSKLLYSSYNMKQNFNARFLNGTKVNSTVVAHHDKAIDVLH